VVSIITVALWCANTILQPYTGNMGVVAVLPMVAFFGFGVLNKDDFNGFLWNVVMLAMGGSALGESVGASIHRASTCARPGIHTQMRTPARKHTHAHTCRAEGEQPP